MAQSPKAKAFVDKDKEAASEFRKRMKARAKGSHTIPKLPYLRPPRKTRRTHLIIGDSHANDEEPNQRFESLGRMVSELSPHVVLDIGDSADMSSLLLFDSGSKSPIFEGHAYWRDIDSYHDAKERYHHYLGKAPARMRHIRIVGNHEHRIDRVLEVEPRFRGIIGLEDLGDVEFGWEVQPFLEPIRVDGVVYSHYFKSPGSHRPVGGLMPARAVLLKYPGSFTRVFGHTHAFGFFEDAEGSPGEEFKKITSINCGCYFDPRMASMRWAMTDRNRWRAGILVMEVEPDGQLYSWNWYDYWDVQRRWGK